MAPRRALARLDGEDAFVEINCAVYFFVAPSKKPAIASHRPRKRKRYTKME